MAIVRYVAQLIHLSPGETHALLRARVPFEAIMEILLDVSPDREILDLFEGRTPNRNHQLLAKLAKSGLIESFVTTNFDTLLEDALEEERVDFSVYSSEVDFSAISWKNDSLPVIKLHGTIKDRTNLGVTIRAVANQERVDTIKLVIREIFGTPRTNLLMVLGYSCSDRFDITPALASLSPKAQPLIYFQHVPSRSQRLTKRPLSEGVSQIFDGFPGFSAYCDIDRLVAYLWQATLNGPVPRLKRTGSGWLRVLDRWRHSLEDISGLSTVHMVAARLLQAGGLYPAAINHGQDGLREAGDPHIEGKIQKFIGDNLRDLGEFQQAIERHELALDKATEAGDEALRAEVLSGIGIAQEDQGKHSEAIAYHRQARTLAKRLPNRELEGKCEGNAGIAFKNRGCEGADGTSDFRTAIFHQERALEIARELGDKRSEGRTLGNLGIAYSNLGNVPEAVRYYKEARRIARDLGDQRHLGIWHFNAGEDLLSRHPEEAEHHVRIAKDIFQALRLPHYVAMCDEHLEKLAVRS